MGSAAGAGNALRSHQIVAVVGGSGVFRRRSAKANDVVVGRGKGGSVVDERSARVTGVGTVT